VIVLFLFRRINGLHFDLKLRINIYPNMYLVLFIVTNHRMRGIELALDAIVTSLHRIQSCLRIFEFALSRSLLAAIAMATDSSTDADAGMEVQTALQWS